MALDVAQYPIASFDTQTIYYIARTFVTAERGIIVINVDGDGYGKATPGGEPCREPARPAASLQMESHWRSPGYDCRYRK